MSFQGLVFSLDSAFSDLEEGLRDYILLSRYDRTFDFGAVVT